MMNFMHLSLSTEDFWSSWPLVFASFWLSLVLLDRDGGEDAPLQPNDARRWKNRAFASSQSSLQSFLFFFGMQFWNALQTYVSFIR